MYLSLAVVLCFLWLKKWLNCCAKSAGHMQQYVGFLTIYGPSHFRMHPGLVHSHAEAQVVSSTPQ